METFLKDKKINNSVFILLVLVSLFFVVKFINEIKSNYYIGHEDQPTNTISVNGHGEVLAYSDIALININISKDGEIAKEAQDSLNEYINKTLEYLKEQKIEEKDIKSEYGGLSPKYSYERCYYYPCPTNSKITGYTASQNISIKIRDIDNANSIKTGLANLGITDISGPTFSIDNEENLKNEARNQAITKAKLEAKNLSKQLGVRLGKIVGFSDNENNVAYPMYNLKSEADTSGLSSSVPVLPKGESKIISDIVIIYEIK